MYNSYIKRVAILFRENNQKYTLVLTSTKHMILLNMK